MGLIDRLASAFGYTKASRTSYAEWLRETAAWSAYDLPSLEALGDQADLYRTLSWIHIAVSAVAKVALTATLSVKRRNGEELVDIPNHPFEVLLENPCPMDSRSELFYATLAYYKLAGNAYWWLNRTSPDQPPSEIWWIPADRIQPVPDGQLYLKGYTYDPGNGHKIALEPWEVCHFKQFNPKSRYVGMSEIEPLINAAKAEIAMQRWNVNFFSKNNAKPSGALAFADRVGDVDWERLKRETKEEYGGDKRALMMLRGVGAGGVQFIANTIPQKEMEFLAGRQFNKEEMFGALAPGLASVLAINATEANAKAGSSTFREMAVWPALTIIAEKITQSILPGYGENLVADYDEIRLGDRAMDLAERQAYERTHTIDEVRQQFDGDAPIGGLEGSMLVAVANSTRVVATPPPEQQAGEPVEEQPPAEEQLAAEVRAELGQWRRYAIKRGAAKANEFECKAIPGDLADIVRGRLAMACCESEVKAAFVAPFRRDQSYP